MSSARPLPTPQPAVFPEVVPTNAIPDWLAPAPGEVRSADFLHPGEDRKAADRVLAGEESVGLEPTASDRTLPATPDSSDPVPSDASVDPTPNLSAPHPDVAAAQHALEADREAFVRAIADLAGLRRRTLESVEADLLAVAVEIASAILERELATHPESHGDLVAAAVRALGDDPSIGLRASQEAHAALIQVFGEPTVEVDGVSFSVALDPTLEGLGCVADSESGQVDGRLPERLGAVRRALADEQRRRQLEDSE